MVWNLTMRKLARIERVAKVSPIPDADSIEVATVQSWNVVIKKGEFKEGDLCVYCEIDSFLPVREEFEFLRKSSYKKMEDKEGFRLRTLKLRGQVSQGLLLPLSIIDNGQQYPVGYEVTDLLGITKYEPPIPAGTEGTIKGGFPSFISKTDEERIQNLADEYSSYKNTEFYATEKLDGTSITCYVYEGSFGVCQRNYELEEANNMYWETVARLGIKEKLMQLNKNIALQGELIGPSIQGNPYQLKERTIKVFSVFDIDNGRYYEFEEFTALTKELSIDTVPLIETSMKLPETIDMLLQFADGKSALNLQTNREGLVLRSLSGVWISFKVISNQFLLSEK